MNLIDVILILILVAALTFAVRLVVSGRRKGSSCHGCGGECASCGHMRELNSVPGCDAKQHRQVTEYASENNKEL